MKIRLLLADILNLPETQGITPELMSITYTPSWVAWKVLYPDSYPYSCKNQNSKLEFSNSHYLKEIIVHERKIKGWSKQERRKEFKIEENLTAGLHSTQSTCKKHVALILPYTCVHTHCICVYIAYLLTWFSK